MVSLTKKLVAELIGTFILVFCGTGAMVVNELNKGIITHAGIAITFGLVVMSLIYALGDVSGAHFNPAVSIAFCVAKRFSLKDLLPFIVVQLAGAALASFTLQFLFPESEYLGATMPTGSELQAFILELIITFFLMLVIINVASGSKEKGLFAGIAIGASVLLCSMFAGPVCGASMNPARSFGPALALFNFQSIWIYFTAPVAGAVLAILLWNYLKK